MESTSETFLQSLREVICNPKKQYFISSLQFLVVIAYTFHSQSRHSNSDPICFRMLENSGMQVF